MQVSTLNRLSSLILDNVIEIIRQWTEKVMRVPQARQLDRPTLIDHMPDMIQHLGNTIRKHEELAIDSTTGNGTSEAHGALRFQAGFDVVEVVAEYNVLREVLHEFAYAHGIPITEAVCRIINRTIDHAIAFAVKAYADEKTIELQRRREEHLAFVIHDLRTPLAAIETALHILDIKLREARTPELGILNIAKRNARRLEALISQVLHEQVNLQTRVMYLEKREMDLWPLVEAMVEEVRPLADTAHTQLINEVPQELEIFADARALARVFQNLISNAIEHTKCGKITVGARNVSKRMQFWVKDSGEGIPSDRLERIFDKLETDRPEEGGLGLGLAIVKEIIEAHGWRISVESLPGAGSTFTVTIPAMPDSLAH
jgi:signal transduction histidine kinase